MWDLIHGWLGRVFLIVSKKFMYGLIALYLGYALYLIIFIRSKKRDFLSKEITFFLGLKLVALTLLYFFFFSDKMTKLEREKNIQNLIVTEN